MSFNVDSTGLYLVMAISAGAGLIVGVILSALFPSSNNKSQKVSPPRKGLVDVAHLWRSKANGALVIQIEDQTLDVGQSVNMEQRQFLADLLADLNRWLGVQNTPSGVTPQQIPSTPSAAPIMPPIVAESSPSPVAPKPFAVPLHESPPITPPPATTEKPSLLNPIRSLRYLLENEATQKLEQQKVPPSIAAQVDEILQAKMKGTRFEQQGIRLMELPGKGMVVMVGLQQFDSIDSVTDPQVKILLKAAVAEWEKRAFR